MTGVDPAEAPTGPIVVCPLDFERRRLRCAGLHRRFDLQCCGPGAAGVRRWAEGRDPPGPVVLCGVAGAVRDGFPAGSAYAAAAVVDGDGRRLVPALGAGERDGPVVGSAGAALVTPDQKRAWAQRTGCDLVDLESAAFAEIAAARGWRWAVVRGVSDGPDTELPAGIDRWADETGRARLWPVLRALLGRRVTLAQLRRLRADGLAAMREAAGIVERMLEP